MVADERDRADVKRRRDRWQRHQGRIDPTRLVFIDEIWMKTNMAPLRGRAPKGERLPGARHPSGTGTPPPSSLPCAMTASMRPGCSMAP